MSTSNLDSYVQSKLFPYGMPENGNDQSTQSGSSLTVDDLARMRRELMAILRAMDTGHKAESRATIPARLALLRQDGRLPRSLSSLMLLINEYRNGMEYEGLVLTQEEDVILRNAWTSITRWASGLQVVMSQ